MVFAVGDDDNSLSCVVILCKTVHSDVYGTADVGALGAYERGIYIVEKHLGRDIVAGDRQLYECIARKNYKTYLVVRQSVDEVLHHHLALV